MGGSAWEETLSDHQRRLDRELCRRKQAFCAGAVLAESLGAELSQRTKMEVPPTGLTSRSCCWLGEATSACGPGSKKKGPRGIRGYRHGEYF